MSDGDREEEDRQAVLRRRARLIGAALSGVVASTSATACACLSPYWEDDAGLRDAGRDGGLDAGPPQPCLSPPLEDAGEPMDAAPDDGAVDGGSAPDAAPDDAG